MNSLTISSAVARRNSRYLALCLATGSALACAACASDDSDESDQQASSAESKSSEDKTSADKSDAKKSSDSKDTDTAAKGDEPVATKPSEQSAEQEAGLAKVMRFDGNWKGKTSQDKPVSLKVLNRFLAHIEVGYALEGDGCKSEDKTVKLSAMQSIRGDALMLTTTSSSEKLTVSGKFTADNAAEGMFNVEVVGDVPSGCSSSVSGTWKASK